MRILDAHSSAGRAIPCQNWLSIPENRRGFRGGETHQISHGENQLLIDKAIDHQPMIRRIIPRHTTMMAFKAKAVWGDDTVKFVDRG